MRIFLVELEREAELSLALILLPFVTLLGLKMVIVE
jgi:hypothetical protein